MIVSKMEIEEVIFIEPKLFVDSRGYFLETHNQKRYAEIGMDRPFVQDNISQSQRGVLRGLHYQQPNSQGKLLMVVEGEIFDVAVDIRKNSKTFGKWTGKTLSGEKKHQIWVPPGFAHGFLVLSQTATIHYKCTDFYAPANERTLSWNDPDVGINWPIKDGLIISDKDKMGHSLRAISI